MSYLDVPRLHFAGSFTASPSTINNTATNYNPANTSRLNLSWNPYGSHAWTVNATVTSYVDENGNLHTSGDPIIGASVQSYAPRFPAKLVDLDTDQQSVTRLFGLNLQISIGGQAALTGRWDDAGTLIFLWSQRFPNGSGDNSFGGGFQSVIETEWGQQASSVLDQLRQASPEGLSVRLSTFGYEADHEDPRFRQGTIFGTIGPYRPGEPRHMVAGRLLRPMAGSPLWYAPGKVDETRSTLTLDLGNSLPDEALGGPPQNLGPLQAAILAPQSPVLIGTIDYSPGSTFAQTAGVVQLALTPEQLQQIASNPIGLLLPAGGGPWVEGSQYATGLSTVALAESPDGSYVDADGASLYMNPGDQANGVLYATTFGKPAANLALAVEIMPQGQNNVPPPPKGVAFPASVTTDSQGRAEIPIQASDPVPREPRRRFIDGQVYFLGGPWAIQPNLAGAPLSVKVFNSIDPPIENPTWKDVEPVLYQFYWLYAYMASIVDLSSYESVKANAKAIQSVLALPFTDPNFMPVTREMSRDQHKLILDWIAQGCPQ